ncbi:MAG: FHA domain-containing protein [Kiritimatiellia bacterium]
MNDNPIHLVVEEGADKGKTISVAPDGARVGRSSKNDIVLVDPLLSRHHCRLFFKTNDGLWVTDLGSANETHVNDKPVQESALRAGDVLAIGDTTIRVVNDGINSLPSAGAASGGPVVDLGFGATKTQSPRRKIGLWPLVMIACLLTAVALAAWIPRFLRKERNGAPAAPVAAEDSGITFTYEKVRADADNIFRYNLTLNENNVLSAKIDDIENDTHLRKEKAVEEALLDELIRSVRESGFFSLDPQYEGIQPGIYHLWDLSVTIGRDTHRSTVINRLEPESFRETREMIEDFAKNELGLWTLERTPEELKQMAEEELLLGRKLYDEREIDYSNLHKAVKSYEKAKWLLESVEPKPDFYGDIVASLSDCREELQRRYEDATFRAVQAMKLKQWEKAAEELKIILRMIPERSDERNRDARSKLLNVQNHLEAEEEL